MATPLLKGRARVVGRLTGLVFLTVMALLVALAVALYQKAFTPAMSVTVRADRAGNQLTKGADVKVRGLRIGEVSSVGSSGDGALLGLKLDPGQAGRLPADLKVQLLPKTLFGEKFVDLVIDVASTGRRLRDGDVIAQDHSQAARETSQALDDLLPLLQTLQPQQVSTTLNALSSALRGRGDQIGANLEVVDRYLKGINPSLPTLGEDFRGMADLADTLESSRPDLLRVLDNLSFSSRSLVDTAPQLSQFLTSTTTSTGELDRLLRDNENRLITLAADSRPPLALFERYSPGFSCLLHTLADQEPLGERAFGGLQPGLHITVEVVQDQGGYRAGDETVFGDHSDPTCFGLYPSKPIVPFPIKVEPVDGYCDEQERTQPGIQTECPGRGSAAPLPGPGSLTASGTTRARQDQDRAVVAAVAGPMLRVAPDEVPDLAMLLFAPIARGTTVGLSTD